MNEHTVTRISYPRRGQRCLLDIQLPAQAGCQYAGKITAWFASTRPRDRPSTVSGTGAPRTAHIYLEMAMNEHTVTRNSYPRRGHRCHLDIQLPTQPGCEYAGKNTAGFASTRPRDRPSTVSGTKAPRTAHIYLEMAMNEHTITRNSYTRRGQRCLLDVQLPIQLGF